MSRGLKPGPISYARMRLGNRNEAPKRTQLADCRG
jgi:hypothetical protein